MGLQLQKQQQQQISKDLWGAKNDSEGILLSKTIAGNFKFYK